MLNQQIAIAAVQEALALLEPLPVGDTWVVYQEATQEHGFGWVVFYGSRLYRETGEAQHALAGNAPFLVNRHTGEVIVTGTAESTEYYVARYQESLANAGGFHRDGVDPAGPEPIGQGVKVGGEAGKLAHRLIVAIRRHGHEVRGTADVDAGGVGVGGRGCEQRCAHHLRAGAIAARPGCAG